MVLRRPLVVTLQLLHPEYPHIEGKFDFLFYQCSFFPLKGVELEMCFYIGSGHQSSPPAPTKEGVYIQAAARRLYTRRLGGYMSQSDWNNEVQDLKNKLSSFGITNVDTSRYN
jgi:hypothetical protein